MKLLIADDELTTRIFLRKIILKWGYSVVDANDGISAMDILTGDNPPRIAILDWNMPGMTGLEICSKLKNSLSSLETYIILLTSRKDKKDIVLALDTGAHDYLTKPVYVNELRSRIGVGKRLVKAHDKLKELNKIKNKFLGMAAHDLRNPLSAIANISQMIRSGMLDNDMEKRNQFLDTIDQTAQHMMSLINDFLSISTIESGHFELRKGRNDLKKIIIQCISMNQNMISKKNMDIKLETDNIPPFEFDKGKILQVVDNLLNNAVKFSPKGSLIHIDLKEKSGMACVSVKDQGPGISDNDQKKLFSEFQCIEAKPTAGEKGTGLGLTITKKILDAHNGKIEIKSEPDKGSTFRFYLPMK